MFGKIAEIRMKEALLKGELQNLPGEGKPLQLENHNPFITKEDKMIAMVLKSAGELPIEIILLKEIESIEQELTKCKIAGEKESLKQKLKGLRFKYEIQRDARSNFFNN